MSMRTALAPDRLIGVIRAPDAATAVWAARAAAMGGLRWIEITLTTPEAPRAIAELAADPALVVGAGTVLTPQDARDALAAGARYLVSPHTDPLILELARAAGAWAVPGAATPTELLAAHRLGAEVIKVFPAEALGGPRYLRLVRDPMPFLALMPTGGVDGDNLVAYLEAGAVGVGVATALFPRQAVARRDAAALAAAARTLLERARGVR